MECEAYGIGVCRLLSSKRLPSSRLPVAYGVILVPRHASASSRFKALWDFRYQQLQAAIEKNSDKVEVFRRTIDSLENAIAELQTEMVQAEEAGIWVALFGMVTLLLVKCAQGIMANLLLERRFSDWLSDRTIKAGLAMPRILLSAGFILLIYAVSIIHFGFPGSMPLLTDFPTEPIIRSTAINWVKEFFNYIILKGEWFFDIITLGIRVVLDSLELLFVKTPWIVIASFIILLTGLSAGPRAAIYSAAFLSYMGLLGLLGKSHDHACAVGHRRLY